jgi:hypothetical protein
MPTNPETLVKEAYDASAKALAAVQLARKLSKWNDGALKNAETAMKQAIGQLVAALQGSLPLGPPPQEPSDSARPQRKAITSVHQIDQSRKRRG